MHFAGIANHLCQGSLGLILNENKVWTARAVTQRNSVKYLRAQVYVARWYSAGLVCGMPTIQSPTLCEPALVGLAYNPRT